MVTYIRFKINYRIFGPLHNRDEIMTGKRMKKIQLSDQDIIRRSTEFAAKKMQTLKPSHGWDHVQRVVICADRIARNEKADSFIVKVAAILHDIAREIEDTSSGKNCHAQLGSEMAYEFLKEIGLDETRAHHIAECIAAHRFRNRKKPATIEAMVLFDADKLDSIGAIGIGRAFLFSGEVGAKLHNPGIDIHTTKAYSEEDTAYREYIVKLRRIKDIMLTAEGKRIAIGRHNFMEEFFTRLQAEAEGRM